MPERRIMTLRPAVGPYPTIRLRHRTGISGGFGYVVDEFATYPIPVRRAEEGPVVDDVVCGTCGLADTVRVLDAGTTRTRRRVRAVLAVLGIASFAVITLSHLVVAYLPAFGLLIGGLIAFTLWRREDGVRFVTRPQKRHSIYFVRGGRAR